MVLIIFFFFFFQAEDGIRDLTVTGVQTCALPISLRCWWADTGPAARARVTEVAAELAGADGEPRYVAVLAVAEPVRQCSAVLRLLSRFRADDIGDADVLRVLGTAAHAI